MFIFKYTFFFRNILEEDNIKKRVDEFLNYLTSVISDRHFIIDYNLMFSIEDDIEMLHQITSDMYPFFIVARYDQIRHI